MIIDCFRVRDGVYYPEDGMIKFYLRGRPVIVYCPSALLETYVLCPAVTSPPPAKLKMEWVYPFCSEYHLKNELKSLKLI